MKLCLFSNVWIFKICLELSLIYKLNLLINIRYSKIKVKLKYYVDNLSSILNANKNSFLLRIYYKLCKKLEIVEYY